LFWGVLSSQKCPKLRQRNFVYYFLWEKVDFSSRYLLVLIWFSRFYSVLDSFRRY